MQSQSGIEEEEDPWSLNSNSNSNSIQPPTSTSNHPLNRTPSPSTPSAPTFNSIATSGPTRRRTVASGSTAASASNHPNPQSQPQPPTDWSTLGAGLASLFTNSSQAGETHQSRYEASSIPGRRRAEGEGGQDEIGNHGEGGNGSMNQQQRERDRNKGHSNPLSSNASALDKLEGWFGISPEPLSSSSPSNPQRPSSASRTSTSTSTSKSRLVHVHQVTSIDSLSSIALMYGSDVNSIRRANRLWPGDSAQMRSRIYIPVDQCKFSPASDTEIEEPEVGEWREGGEMNGNGESQLQQKDNDVASEFLPDTNKAYSDLNSLRNGIETSSHLVTGYPASLNPATRAATSTPSTLAPISNSHSRRAASTSSSSVLPRSNYASSSGSAAGSSSASAARQKAKQSQPTRIPNEALSFFPTSIKGKRRMENNNSEETGWAANDPGESGLDDLLAAGERKSGEDIGRPSLDSSTSTSLISSRSVEGRDDGSEWQASKWTFGKGGSIRSKSRRVASDLDQQTSDLTNRFPLKPLHLLERSSSSGGPTLASQPQPQPASRPHPLPPPSSKFSAYASDAASIVRSSTGWNDAPPVDSKVSHAYSGKGSSSSKRNHHRILNDLAAGLPPNSGAAQNWARPIAGSLPIPPPPSNGPPQRNGPSGSSTSASISSIGANAGAGWSKLLNDTLRGRIHLDDAFAAAASQINSSSSNSNPYPQTKLISTFEDPPPKPSAEQARLTLGRSAGSGALQDGIGWEGEDGNSERGAGGIGTENTHRLERMGSENQLKDFGGMVAGGKGSGGIEGGAGRNRQRGNVRRVDWTSES